MPAPQFHVPGSTGREFSVDTRSQLLIISTAAVLIVQAYRFLFEFSPQLKISDDLVSNHGADKFTVATAKRLEKGSSDLRYQSLGERHTLDEWEALLQKLARSLEAAQRSCDGLRLRLIKCALELGQPHFLRCMMLQHPPTIRASVA